MADNGRNQPVNDMKVLAVFGTNVLKKRSCQKGLGHKKRKGSDNEEREQHGLVDTNVRRKGREKSQKTTVLRTAK